MNSEFPENTQRLELAEKHNKLLDALVSGMPISIARSELSNRTSAMGDTFIKAWATKTVLEEFLRQHDRQDHPPVYVSFYEDRNSGNTHFPFDTYFPYAGRPAVQERTCTEISLADMALRMRLKLPPSVFQLRTTPFAFDHPNFNSWEVTYNAPVVISEPKAQEDLKQAIYTVRVSEKGIQEEFVRLREKYEDKEVIVVNIAGSHVFKRFSFAQVQRITHELRQKFEQAHIVVLADQETRIYDQSKNITLPLTQNLNRSELEKRLKIYDPLRAVSFPEDLDYQKDGSINTDVNTINTDIPDADECIVISNMNELAAYGMVADLVVTTDTFWSWWHAPAKNMIVLYTLANDYWLVKGCKPIFSDAVSEHIPRKTLETMLNPDKYYKYFHDQGEGQLLGPSQHDIDRLLQAIHTLPPLNKLST